MRLFLDTADVEAVRTYAAWGVVEGVTTNPSLMARSGRPHEEVIREICSWVAGPVSAEVIATETADMVREGKVLAAWHENVVVKVPLTPSGLAATKALAASGIRTNVTLCFSAAQALLAARAGAAYVSPFIGRLDDKGEDGMALIEQIVEIFRASGDIYTQVLVASVRSVNHVVQAARLGADVATVPPAILSEMVHHDLTDQGLAAFLADWKKACAVAAPDLAAPAAWGQAAPEKARDRRLRSR